MKFKRILKALAVLGPKIMAMETIRRISRRAYVVDNIVKIRNNVDFITLFYLIENNIKLEKEDDFIVAITKYGKFYVWESDFSLLLSLINDPEEDYGFIKYNDKSILDIGAYYGDTALFFLKKGARILYLYEPVEKIFKYLLLNLEKNQVDKNRYQAFDVGAWTMDDIIYTRFNMQGTGLYSFIDENDCLRTHDCVTLRVKALDNIIRSHFTNTDPFDNIVKIDCEGCEYSIVNTPCDTLLLASNHIVEIHGTPNPIIYKYKKCGFKAELRKKQTPDYITIWHFYKST